MRILTRSDENLLLLPRRNQDSISRDSTASVIYSKVRQLHGASRINLGWLWWEDLGLNVISNEVFLNSQDI